MAYSDGTALETAVYVSKAATQMSTPSLFGLLAKARANNRANGVTGVLLYSEGVFLQVLEGAAGALDATLARIEKDERHQSMQIVYRDMLKTRVFDGWTLGFGVADDTAVSLMRQIQAELDKPEGEAGRAVHQLLCEFYASAYPRVAG